MAEQRFPCSRWKDYGGADISPQPMERATVEQTPTLQPVEDPMLEQVSIL